jgi:hypothetical protein
MKYNAFNMDEQMKNNPEIAQSIEVLELFLNTNLSH